MNKVIMFIPPPGFPDLKCRTCGAKKNKLGEKDNLKIDMTYRVAKGYWYCPNGHLNREE